VTIEEVKEETTELSTGGFTQPEEELPTQSFPASKRPGQGCPPVPFIVVICLVLVSFPYSPQGALHFQADHWPT